MPDAPRSLRSVLRRWLAPALVAGAIATSPAAASEQPDSDEPAAEVTTGDGPVDTDFQPSDRRIAERLRGILDATERFSDLELEVRDGVVFLSGTAESEEARTLAADIARRTNGVAAVANNLTLPDEPFWSLEPARRELEALTRDVVGRLPLILAGIVLLALFVLLARVASRAASRLFVRRSDSELLRGVARNASFLIILVIGAYLALRVSGLTSVAITVISGTGLLGLALGFAFRDIAENFLASLLLSIQRPFRIGDVIEVESHQGIVRKVTSRGTLLIDFDGNHIQIANAAVYKSTIKNFSANPNRRIHFQVGIGYDDRITLAQQVVLDMLADHPAVLAEPEPLVLVEELGASTVNLKVYLWINAAEHSVPRVKSSVIRLAARALEQAGVSMPDEAREVIFPNGVPVRMLESDDAGDRASRQGPGDTSDRTGQAGAMPGKDASATAAAAAAEDEQVAVAAEGDLTTETHDLNRQAEASRDPEEGANVLGEPDDGSTETWQ